MTPTSELIERLRRRTVPICGGAGVYDVVLGEKPDALCQEAADALERLSSPNDGEGWLPIESAPKDGRSILAIWQYDPDDPTKGCATHEVVRWCGWWDASGFTRPDPSHWRPLPEPPRSVAGQAEGPNPS